MSETVSASAFVDPAWRLLHQGDRCLLVCLGDRLDGATAARCLNLAQHIRQAAWPGVTDVVPAFTTVAVHYQPQRADGLSAAELTQRLEALLSGARPVPTLSSRQIDIPVHYGGAHGPDLPDVARACGLSEAEVIALHSQTPCTVFMLGFAPGFAYLGIHDARLDLPRRATPRTEVPPGSVAIANRQSVIYPGRLPGGWSLIGTTPLTLFDPAHEPAALLQPGDRVRFVPISADAFDAQGGRP